MDVFPSFPKPASATVSSFSPTVVSVTHGLKRQVRSRGAHLWSIELSWPPKKRAAFAALWAFAVAQRGQYGVFEFILPEHPPRGVATGTPVVDGADQTGRTLATSGWTPSTSGILKIGDFLKLETQAKVYMLTADAASDGSGNALLSIEPALVSVPSDGEEVVVHDVPFTVSFAEDLVEVPVSKALLYTMAARLVEDL